MLLLRLLRRQLLRLRVPDLVALVDPADRADRVDRADLAGVAQWDGVAKPALT